MEDKMLELLNKLVEGQATTNKRLDEIQTQQLEDHQILKALEHKAEVNRAEHDKMANDINHIKGDVETIRKDISTVEIVTANNWSDIAKLKAVK